MGLRRHKDNDPDAMQEGSETAGEAHSEPAPDPAPPMGQTMDGDSIGNLTELWFGVMSRFDELCKLTSDGFTEQARSGELFNRLYDDLEEQKRERLNEGRLPLYRALLLVLDRLESLQLTHPDCASEFSSVHHELLDTLGIDGVTEIEQDARSIDHRRQSVVGVVPSLPEPMVWRSVRTGYEIGPRVIRPQQIEVVQATE